MLPWSGCRRPLRVTRPRLRNGGANGSVGARPIVKEAVGVFPFGQPVRLLTQPDRAPRQVFLLGVYASAVHARWIGADGKTRVQALAVASEPEIFWRGDSAEEVIRQVAVPPAAGRLEPAARALNGPSGRALDQYYLDPLGIDGGQCGCAISFRTAA